MIDNGKGTVINIASIGAFVAGGGGAAYTSAKHGIAGYTKQLSFDYGLKGIKANAIAPGAVDTGMTHAMFEEGSADVMKKQILYLLVVMANQRKLHNCHSF